MYQTIIVFCGISVERRPIKSDYQMLSLNVEALLISHGLKVQTYITVHATHKGHLMDEMSKMKVWLPITATNHLRISYSMVVSRC